MGESPEGTRPVASRRDHLYGGQAVIEGVMMRGRDHWAVAVRRPDGDLHAESHRVRSVGNRYPFLRAPGLRGVLALGQALSIGLRALTISANQAAPEDQKLTKRQMAGSMAFALVVFILVFIAGPAVLFKYAGRGIHSSLLVNVLEGLFRVALFLGYLALIGRMNEVRRVFQYHGAEHKTIAAYEHDAPLEPESIDRFSTLHVRCGTNFLLIVMILSIFVFALFGNPPLLWRVLSRVVAIPVIAGIAFEILRLGGARYHRSMVMRALMAPGLWLQKITTKAPSHDQIEVAVASFQAVLAAERTDDGSPPARPLPAGQETDA